MSEGKRETETDRQKKEEEKSPNQRQREGEKARKENKNKNMLSTYYATKWNETSQPKSVHVYLLFHQQIPAIPSKNIIPKGHPQHTIKPHFHSVCIFVAIFHTAHRATGSSSLVVFSKQYRISV